MEMQDYRISDMLISSFAGTVKFFGLWFWISVLKFFIFVVEMSCASFVALFFVNAVIKSIPGIPALVYPEGMEHAQIYIADVRLVLLALTLLLVFALLGGVVRMGAVQVAFDLQAGGKSSFARVFTHTNLAWRHLGASALFNVGVFFGLCLLIVPGVVFAYRYWFYRQVLVEQGCGIFDALQTSAQLTKGKFGQLAPSLFLLGILNEPMLHSAFLLGLITGPLSTLGQVFLYKNILVQKTHGI